MPLNSEEHILGVADLCSKKWEMLRDRPLAFLLSAFAGGAFVCFGAMLALAVSAGVPQNLAPGLANLLMGLVFMFSLVIIMFSGMTLVTADMAYGLVGVFQSRISWGQFALGVFAGYVGNFTGSMSFMWIMSKGGGYHALPWLMRAHDIGLAKTGETAMEIFVMGIICTWTLQSAAILFMKTNDDMSKIMLTAYGPLAFVAGMNEHCIANIGFLAVPLFQQDLWIEAVSNMNEITPVLMHWGFGKFGWAHNQLFTVMGNAIGGTLFVAVIFQLVVDPLKLKELYRKRRMQTAPDKHT
ncbi:formate/nitrite transporter family protein [Desulfovibrio ferrophilus]|uniref:Formate/nitrite transporter n=1 Tax=Desulfovibrio ferrophilus TaxID=241368 RepID=A0A2Z6AUA2_9BACT|nr:formate/nitrite transporter family protein [Desulfovibrio ferrophilus]BBD06805.1 formate/nitrite transporter [Desulfovibrio ferrophilus]